MSFSSKYNHKRLFNVSTKGAEFRKIPDYVAHVGCGVVNPVKAFMISHKGRYGASCSLFTDIGGGVPAFWLNMPNSMVDTVAAILDDDEAVQAVNDGNVGFTVRPYHSERYNKDCYAIDFVDLEDEKNDD